MKIHVGTSGFAYKEWKGTFYPSTTAPEEMRNRSEPLAISNFSSDTRCPT